MKGLHVLRLMLPALMLCCAFGACGDDSNNDSKDVIADSFGPGPGQDTFTGTDTSPTSVAD